MLAPPFEAGAALELMESERITALLGVPTMYQFLLRHTDLGRRDLSAWRTAVFGAAPMPAATVEELIARFPGLDLFQMCGQTEAGPTGLYSTLEQLRARPDSSGHQAQPFVEARIVDGAGQDVRPGQVGELLLRGEPVMKGYWGRPEATAEALRDGWLHTGDLFRVDADGALVLVDRLKDLIITGGQNVYSAEVEQALRSHPDVDDCAVIGRPHGEYGQTVVAVVTPREGAEISLDGLRAHASALIAHYKLPRELIIGPVPRNVTGKLQKQLLRDSVDFRPLT